MSVEQALALLVEKWITPIITGINSQPAIMFSSLSDKMVWLCEKYEKTFSSIRDRISQTEKVVSGYVSDLRGDAFIREGLLELKKILGGGNNECE